MSGRMSIDENRLCWHSLISVRSLEKDFLFSPLCNLETSDIISINRKWMMEHFCTRETPRDRWTNSGKFVFCWLIGKSFKIKAQWESLFSSQTVLKHVLLKVSRNPNIRLKIWPDLFSSQTDHGISNAWLVPRILGSLPKDVCKCSKRFFSVRVETKHNFNSPGSCQSFISKQKTLFSID